MSTTSSSSSSSPSTSSSVASLDEMQHVRITRRATYGGAKSPVIVVEEGEAGPSDANGVSKKRAESLDGVQLEIAEGSGAVGIIPAVVVNDYHYVPPTAVLFACYTCSTMVEAIPPSSTTVPTYPNQPGIMMPCHYSHSFCYDCISLYIQSKLDDGKLGKKVFPMLCPLCPDSMYAWHMDLNSVEKIMQQAYKEDEEKKKELVEEWSHQKLIEEYPKMFCPNSKCSEILIMENFDCLNAECPKCDSGICVPCRSITHQNMTCSQWMKSPLCMNEDEVRLRRMAKRNHWRRCNRCRIVVERIEGCSHMACRCGFQFCHLCGSEWINGCTRIKCGRWQKDKTLYVPSRFSAFVRQAATLLSLKPEETTQKPKLTNRASAPADLGGMVERPSLYRRATTWARR